MDYSTMAPAQVRALIREEKITGQTSGMCSGYAQANLVILPKDLAYDFLLFTQRNPKSCPVLEVSDVGSRQLHYIAKDVDIARDIPKYRIYRKGELAGEYTNVEDFWQDDFVSFLIGCSFPLNQGFWMWAFRCGRLKNTAMSLCLRQIFPVLRREFLKATWW